MEITVHTKIVSLEPEQRRFFGWSYVAKDRDGSQIVDHSGDIIADITELEDAAYSYVAEARSADLDHKSFGGAKLIESFMLTEEKAAAMGLENVPVGHWVGFEADASEKGEALWGAVKDGKSALSIVYTGWRE